jgi:uncharacterized protein
VELKSKAGFAMLTTIPHLSRDQSKALEEKILQIVKESSPEKIICFGARTNDSIIWSSFSEHGDRAKTMECDLLILTRDGEKAKRDEVANNVSKLCNASLRFTTLVHSVDAAIDELKRGNYFFSSLYHKGVLLYDHQTFSLPAPSLTTHSLKKLEPYWKNRLQLAQNFFTSADHALTQGWNEQAVFMLHQVMEHLCIALIKIHMGYKANTHKLSRLLSMVENFSLFTITVFPRITKDEIRLFNMLETAYIDARYDSTYAISTDRVNALKEEVEDFLVLAQAMVRERMQALETHVEKHSVSPFESIGLDTFARVVLQKGEEECVEIESKYDSAQSVKINVEESRLWITTSSIKQDKILDAAVYITYKTLSGLVVNHIENLSCRGILEVEKLGLIHNGPGNIDLAIDVNALDVTVNKHGNVQLSGSANEAKIFSNRTGNFNGKDLEISDAKIIMKGSGNVSIHVEDELEIELHGTGNLLLNGAPRIKRLELSGTGTMKLNN